MKTLDSKILTKSELKSFKPILEGNLSDLKESQLKKMTANAKKAARKYKSKPKTSANKKTNDKKSGLFSDLFSRLERRLMKIEKKLPGKKARNFHKNDPSLTADQKLKSRKTSRVAASKKAPTEEKHWEKTPINRLAGFQSSRGRLAQGAIDNADIKDRSK